MQIRTKGGSRETLVNELTVIPCGVPSGDKTVVIVTPVGKLLHARRNCSRSNEYGCIVPSCLRRLLQLHDLYLIGLHHAIGHRVYALGNECNQLFTTLNNEEMVSWQHVHR